MKKASKTVKSIIPTRQTLITENRYKLYKHKTCDLKIHKQSLYVNIARHLSN